MPNEKKRKSRVQAVIDNRTRMLADRLAILLVICNARDEDDWNPWALDRSYDGAESMGQAIRQMRDYRTAKTIVRRWLETTDKATIAEYENDK